MGGFLVAAAGVVVFAAVVAGAGGTLSRNYVVATRDMRAGTVIQPQDLTVRSMRLPPTVAAGAFSDPHRLLGASLAVGISSGELLETSMIAGRGATLNLRPVTISVDAASLGPLSPGDPVDVLDTSGNGSATAVFVVLRGATVLSVARPGTGLLVSAASAQVTIGVPTLSEVEAVVAAIHAGTVTLVVAQPSDGVGPGPGPGGGSAG